MMTSVKYYVAWVSTISHKRNTLSNSKLRPVVEAAKAFELVPTCTDIEVRNVDTGEEIDWRMSEAELMFREAAQI